MICTINLKVKKIRDFMKTKNISFTKMNLFDQLSKNEKLKLIIFDCI